MKTRVGLLLTCATSALLIGLTGADAADQAQSAPAPTEWWTNGYVEIGGRFFLSKQGGQTAGNKESLGKFYEYRDLREGPIGEFGFAGGSKDGLYLIEALGRNVGYEDQKYQFDISKAGEHYFSFGWDQTPHIYNDKATTIYSGAGSNNLTLSSGLRSQFANQLSAAAGNNPPLPTTNAQRLNIATIIDNNLNSFSLGFRRDVATAEYRWTPDDKWDVRTDYTRIRRDGTQPVAALAYQISQVAAPVGTGPYSGSAEQSGRFIMELPKPIADTTHNANATAEYAGSTPWGSKYNVAFGGGYSAYQNDYNSFNFQSPWVPDAATVNVNPGDQPYQALNNVYSLAPSNSAANIRINGGVDLPMKSRYTGTVNYTMARQDDAFLPFSSNTMLAPQTISQNGSVVGSLNAGNNNLLVNNALTTRWTPTVRSTLRYRYFDFDSTTSPTDVSGWYVADANVLEGAARYYPVAYTKQNASADAAWQATKWLTVGSGVYWERWDRDRRDVNITDELTGKVFADIKANDWSRIRTTYFHADRRLDSYDPLTNPGAGQTGYRLFDMSNRSRDKGIFSVDLYAPNNVTVTPTGGFRYDDYGVNPYAGELGVTHEHGWNAGMEISWQPTRAFNVMFSYMHEEVQRQVIANNTLSGTTRNGELDVQTADRINTFILGTKFTVIPQKFDVTANFIYTIANASLTGSKGPVPSNSTLAVNSNAFPDIDQQFTRFDLQGRYIVDPEVVRRFGWTGETYIRLRYMWERSLVNDWAAVNQNYLWLIDTTQGGSSYTKSIFMGWNDPNYNVQLVTLAFGVKW